MFAVELTIFADADVICKAACAVLMPACAPAPTPGMKDVEIDIIVVPNDTNAPLISPFAAITPAFATPQAAVPAIPTVLRVSPVTSRAVPEVTKAVPENTRAVPEAIMAKPTGVVGKTSKPVPAIIIA